jgi:hypothetical protein
MIRTTLVWKRYTPLSCDTSKKGGNLLCDTYKARETPRSWLHASTDGTVFHSCYVDQGEPVPFSEDKFKWTDCKNRLADPNYEPGRFIGVSPIDVPG